MSHGILGTVYDILGLAVGYYRGFSILYRVMEFAQSDLSRRFNCFDIDLLCFHQPYQYKVA